MRPDKVLGMRGTVSMRSFAWPEGFVRPFYLVAILCVAGCGSTNFPVPPEPWGDGRVPGDTPINSNPINTMIRLEATYEFRDFNRFQPLLAADFRFRFSQESDPGLVAAYGDTWDKQDESESARHLFEGFTNTNGDFIAAASRIQLSFAGVQFSADSTHADSAAWYQRVTIGSVDMTVEVPTASEPTIYTISAPHEFYLVRGDAAVLDSTQEARADRWYIRRWNDLAPALDSAGAPADAPAASAPKTWGSLKAQYRF